MERKIKELLTNVKNESQEGMLERIKNDNVKEEDIYFMLKYCGTSVWSIYYKCNWNRGVIFKDIQL